MLSHRLLLAAIIGSVAMNAVAPAYGATGAASGPDTAPAALSDTPAGSRKVVRGVTRPSPVVTSNAVPTLSDALAEVYLTNPALLSTRASLRATDENVPAALAGWRPRVSVSLSPSYQFGTIKQYTKDTTTREIHLNSQNGVTTGLQPNERFAHTEQAQLQQPLYSGGATTAAVAQAENQVRAARARLLGQEEQTFSDTVSAYVTVIEDEQLYELQVSNVQVLGKQLDATNARFSVGEITRTDVAQAQAALAGAVAEREIALGNLQTARGTYRRTVGELPDKLIEPQPLLLPVSSAEEATTLASVNNASVIAAAYDNAVNKDQVDAAYAALMPQVSLQASVFNNSFSSSSTISSNGGSLGGTVTIPIYQGGSEYAAIRQAKQTEQASRKTFDDMRRSAVQQATQYWEQYVASKAAVASDRAQIRADEIALDGVEREALAGTQTTLDVLNAQQLLLSARVTLVQNLASLVMTSYQVAGAIGRLTARDLGLNVPFYDEKAYYKAVRELPFGTNDAATSQPGR